MAQPKHGGNRSWAASLVGCSPCQILDFSASINPLGPPPTALDAINTQLQGLQSYPDPRYGQLRQALAEYHQVPVDWVLPGNGAAELLTWVGRSLSQWSPTHLCVPAFRDYGRALAAFEAQVETHPLTNLAALPTELPARAVLYPGWPDQSLRTDTHSVLINNPHNPTGQLWDRHSILDRLDRFRLVVVDEAFMDFLPPEQQESVIPNIQHHANLVVLRSLTKFYSLPGLRLGYAIAAPPLLQQWQTWRDPWAVNCLADAAGQAVVQDQAFQAQTWAWLPPARQQLFEGLAQLPGLRPIPSAANFLLVAADVSVVELQRRLLEYNHVLIRDCHSFPELGDRYFRVAVRTITENQQLLDGLATVLSQTGLVLEHPERPC